MAGMTYSGWVTAVNSLLQIEPPNDGTFDPASATPTNDPNFNGYIATAILNTETRLQRDLDLLGCYVTDSSGSLTADARSFMLPTGSGTYQVVTQVSVKVGTAWQAPLTPVSRDFLEAVYPADAALASPSVPLYWCPVDQVSILVGPAPDITYPVKVVGTQRLTPLSATATSNFLTLTFPDLYLAASMVEWSGYQRDYGAQSDDPKLAVSWEQRYQDLLKGADIEEARKKFQSTGWQPRQPTQIPPQASQA